MLTDHDKDMMMIGRPLTVYPEKPTSSCMADSVVGFPGKARKETMKIDSIWTDSEGHNVLYALRQKYGDLAPRTLVKYAVRELIETERVRRNIERNAHKCKHNTLDYNQMLVADLRKLVRYLVDLCGECSIEECNFPGPVARLTELKEIARKLGALK